jgi:diguanylate cyclase (GGDEF)-like protein
MNGAVIHRAWAALPKGGALPHDVWLRRHRAVVALLGLHAVGIVCFGVLAGATLLHSLFEGGIIAVAAVLAAFPSAPRAFRSAVATLGLITASAVLVHLSGGLVEMHFHFFVMLGVIALYQDWLPFLLALGYVVVHHGAMGAIDPKAVYNHPEAWEHPWRWALIHGIFVLAASAASLTTWRLSEGGFLDALTGLANRHLFEDRVARAVRAGGPTGRVAVLCLDLDEFKTVNDSLGHAAGDALLVAVATRLRTCVRPGDTVARLGGDEFAVLLTDTDEPGARAVADRILSSLRAPFFVEGKEIFTGVSIGHASSIDQEDAGAILRSADAALYAAKRGGKRRYESFLPSMHTEVLSRLEVHAELQRALERGELLLHYQPINDLATGNVVAVEALVRWNHPRRGILLPTDFVALAEETGLIVPIGHFVIAEACRQARAWQLERPESAQLGLSVNLSPRQLLEPHLVDQVARALEQSGLSPSSLVLEITESVLLYDREAALETLTELRSLGVQLALDDFGTGYSSLIYLRHFPIDILKIARSFVEGVAAGPKELALARAIVQLGRPLGLRVIAEGIETAEQLAVLRSLGVELGQGYHFAMPLPADAVGELLATRILSAA